MGYPVCRICAYTLKRKTHKTNLSYRKGESELMKLPNVTLKRSVDAPVHPPRSKRFAAGFMAFAMTLGFIPAPAASAIALRSDEQIGRAHV